MIVQCFWFSIFFILYTYLGYPLILTVLARFKPESKELQPHTPSVTLLIAAYNEETVIAKKLENALGLDYPGDKLQILVAADGSDDRTVEIVKSYVEQGVELSFSHKRQGKMAAINRAMVVAQGEIVVFSDANNMYSKNVIRDLAAPFADAEVGGVSGAKKVLSDGGVLGESEGFYWKYESNIKKQESRLGTCTGTAGEIFAIRRALYVPPPGEIINDDFYMAMQILKQGSQIKYAPEAVSMEPVSLTPQDEIIRRERIIAGRYQAMSLSDKNLPLKRPLVMWQIISHKFLRPMIPFAMIMAFLSNFLSLFKGKNYKGKGVFYRFTNLFLPFGMIFFICQLGFYLLAALGIVRKGELTKRKLFYLPAFLVNSNLAALKGFYRYISGNSSVNWKKVERQVVENE
ncbi:MAG: glycosyltransferase family 2 protein [Anaerolineaceae bacterium]|nr:glycosyltransferase family 2 protein [Anaerolineaceae bacterium]